MIPNNVKATEPLKQSLWCAAGKKTFRLKNRNICGGGKKRKVCRHLPVAWLHIIIWKGVRFSWRGRLIKTPLKLLCKRGVFKGTVHHKKQSSQSAWIVLLWVIRRVCLSPHEAEHQALSCRIFFLASTSANKSKRAARRQCRSAEVDVNVYIFSHRHRLLHICTAIPARQQIK